MNFRARGVSLIEIIIVIAVLAIIAALSMTALKGTLNAEALDKDTEAVISMLREARGNTISSQGGTQYGVYFSMTEAVLFTGATYDAATSTNRSAAFSGRTDIVTAITGGSTVVFQRLTGQTAHSGTITVRLKSDLTKTKVVIVYPTGLIERN